MRSRQAPLSVAACLVLLVLCGSGCGRLDKDAIDAELKSTQSAAAEGMLVAQQAARGRAPDNFIELRTAELGKEAKSAYGKLSTIPAESGLQASERDASQVAARVAALLLRLHAHSSNRELAASVAARTSRLASRASEIEDSL